MRCAFLYCPAAYILCGAIFFRLEMCICLAGDSVGKLQFYFSWHSSLPKTEPALKPGPSYTQCVICDEWLETGGPRQGCHGVHDPSPGLPGWVRFPAQSNPDWVGNLAQSGNPVHHDVPQTVRVVMAKWSPSVFISFTFQLFVVDIF